METALVTGGAGFLGLQLVRRLQDEGVAVRILDREPPDETWLARPADFVEGDIRDPSVVAQAVRDVEVVFHLAAVLPVAKAGRAYDEVNVHGTRLLLEVCQANRVRRVVFVSSSAVYGIPRRCPVTEETPFRPLGAYGRSKARAEQVCRAFRARGLDVMVLRPRTVIGPGRGGILTLLFRYVAEGRRVYLIGRGTNRFQLISSEDLVEACVRAARAAVPGDDFNVGAAEYRTLREDLQGLIDHAGTGARLCPLPAVPVKTVLWLLDHLGLSPLVDWHYRTPDKDFYFDIRKARDLLGWEPRDSNVRALIKGYEWYRAHRAEIDRRVGTTHRKSVREGILQWVRRWS
ncbi:UDP-glucose 4-epimerase [bacterium HR11]|nr:UDP-glucose 4-epimerase [bacterium HR11]